MKSRRARLVRVWGILAAGLASLAVFAMSATLAQAARSISHDARGDAKAGWDIVRVSVSNGQKNLSLKVVYRGKLKPHAYPGLGLQTGIYLDFGHPADSVYSDDFSVYTIVGAPGSGKTTLLYDKNEHRVGCSGLRSRVRVRAGVVRMVVPQRCFRGAAGRVRIAGSTYAVRGTGRTADYIDRWGRWIALG